MERARGRRVPLRVWLVLVAVIVTVAALAGPGRSWFTTPPKPTGLVLKSVVDDDAGDARATTTFDGPLVRRRAAIGIHPTKDADRAKLIAQVQAVAKAEKLGPLTQATFAVFTPELLKYLVPEVVLVLPEGKTLEDAEVIMKEHDFPTVAFYLAESVVVHDLTFAVIPNGVPVAQVKAKIDRDGILTDSLGRYPSTMQSNGLTIKYFGALLSDGQVTAVRQSMAEAAHVAVDAVQVVPSSPGPGVNLATDTADPDEDATHHHHE